MDHLWCDGCESYIAPTQTMGFHLGTETHRVRSARVAEDREWRAKVLKDHRYDHDGEHMWWLCGCPRPEDDPATQHEGVYTPGGSS